jgi:hypothetical protein
MKTLWTFGDSFTERYTDKYNWSQDYIKWKGYTPKVYGDIISDKLNIDLKNMAKVGSDNYTILERVCENVDKIKDDDLIIIGWSAPTRFRLVNQNETKWISIRESNKNEIDLFGKMISESTLQEILINRTALLYTNEVNNWIKLLNQTFKYNKIIQWSPFIKNFNGIYLNEFNRIKNETNDELKDHHPSEMGHIELANRFVSIINKNII